MRLLLASNSATRRVMLADAGVPFEAVGSDVDEDALKAGLRRQGMTASGMALALAKAKAAGARASDGLVLGCDQMLELDDGMTLDKPRSSDDLLGQLERLSGQTHILHSAAVAVRVGETVWEAVETVEMKMRPLSAAFLADYVAREYDAVRWNVGGYRIEGLGAQLFERIQGSHFAILGLPLVPLLSFLRDEGLLAS